MSWDNGEPLTTEERAAIMQLSRYEREREMNIRRNKRLISRIKGGFNDMFDELNPTSMEGARKQHKPADDGTNIGSGRVTRSNE